MSRRIIITIVVAMLAVVSIAAVTRAQGRSAQNQPPVATGAVGRFAFVTPPVAGAGAPSYNNFVWVLDTQTGKVKGCRIVEAKDTDGGMTARGILDLADLTGGR